MHSRPELVAPALFALALAVRLATCGLAAGDDVIYMTQAIAHGVGGTWPPGPGHWCARIGVTLPVAAVVSVAGIARWSLLAYPLLAGSLLVPVVWSCARRLVAPRTALVTALLLCVLPMQALFSGHLFPDVFEGVYAGSGLLTLVFALRSDRRSLYALAGALLGLSYLHRETIVLLAPVVLGLPIAAGHGWRRRQLWVLVGPLAVLLGELALYAATTGDPLFRVRAVLGMVRDPSNLALIGRLEPGGGFWSGPLWMLVSSHELGPAFALALFVSPWALWRWRELRPFAWWLLAGYLWTFYGTTDPREWTTLPRTPRYAMALCIPAALLCARALEPLGPRLRHAAVAALLALSLLSIGLDQGRGLLAPHRAFVASPLAADSALDPAEYFCARWAGGFDAAPRYACVSDLGKPGLVAALRWLPGTVQVPSAERRFVVLSPHRDGERLAALLAVGRRQVAHFPDENPLLRRLAAQLLKRVPGQEGRAWKIEHGPGLVVLE